MKSKTILALLLISGGFVTPAYANYFHNPYTGINLNIGSAPNPTPEDIRLSRLPAVTQDDAAPVTPVAEAANATPARAPVAQNQAQTSTATAAVSVAAQAR